MLARSVAVVAAAAAVAATSIAVRSEPTSIRRDDAMRLAAVDQGSASRNGHVPPATSLGTYAWPVAGEVIRPFVAPEGPYGAGHRGIDIAAAAGGRVVASADGVVAFAGRVAGGLHVSIDHPDGVRTSYAFLSRVDVRAGAAILRGQTIGASGGGHAGVTPAHLHFGARYAGEYIDPMLLLERRGVAGLIHLAPIEEGGGAGEP